MGRLIAHRQYRDFLLGAALLLAAAALVAWPSQCMDAMRDGLALCGNVIIPSLFPFFVLSTMVVELGMSRYLGKLFQPVMVPLFRVNGACATALALGILGGYPVGARTAITLYQSGQCSRTEAERMLAFCNNCGPAFILGVVGAGMFDSGPVGLLLYFGHICACILVGFLFRFYKAGQGPSTCQPTRVQLQAASLPAVFTHSVTAALSATINICAFILFFTVFIRMLALSGFLAALAELLSTALSPFGLSQQRAEHLLGGLLELTSGLSALRDGTLTGRLSMAAFMLGWAGISVHCQVMAFLGDSGLSLRTYMAGKLLHGALSAVIVALLVQLIPIENHVSAYLVQQTDAIAGLSFQRALTISAACSFFIWLIFLIIAANIIKKAVEKNATMRYNRVRNSQK